MDFARGGPREDTVLELPDAINRLIDKALVEKEAAVPPRTYLGGSRLGVECKRALAFEYHEARDAARIMQMQAAQGEPVRNPFFRFDGRILRIFRDGHRIEDQAISDLRAAGFTILDRGDNGQQFRWHTAHGPDGVPRMSGGLDGVCTVSPIETIKVPCLLEIKSMNAKKFKETKDKGVKEVHKVYYAQMMLYMAYMGLTANPAWFYFYCKDNSEYWHEFVQFDADAAQAASDAGWIVLAAATPYELPRISEDPEFFTCKWCDHAAKCWNPPSLSPALDAISRPDWLK